VVIEIQENHFKINFDSETVLDVTDKDDTYPTGGLGFWVREGNDFLFDDIKVWNLE
jgi:hypothetical protein